MLELHLSRKEKDRESVSCTTGERERRIEGPLRAEDLRGHRVGHSRSPLVARNCFELQPSRKVLPQNRRKFGSRTWLRAFQLCKTKQKHLQSVPLFQEFLQEISISFWGKTPASVPPSTSHPGGLQRKTTPETAIQWGSF